MPIRMTDEQLQAYNCMDRRILVSAAAGSGKTAVLIQRVLRLLREGASLDRMLIITYTNAAAGELRQRLRQSLTDDIDMYPQPYGRALDQIENASISTIHTFGKSLLQEFFEIADVDAAAAVANEAQTGRMLEKAWKDAMKALLGDKSPDFMALSDAFDNDQLQSICMKVYEFMMSLDHPQEWMRNAIAETEKERFEDTVWYTALMREVLLQVEAMENVASHLRRMVDQGALNPKDEALVLRELDMLKQATTLDEQGLPQLIHALKQVSLGRMPAKSASWTPAELEAHEALKTDRDQVKEILGELLQLENVERRLHMELENARPMLRGLQELMRSMMAIYHHLKTEAALVDYHDMEQGAALVLDVEDVRNQVRSRFDHIFVDEFQDVSNVQFGIIGKVTAPDSILFMVGDPKQSIYRFRNADPTIFMSISDTATITTVDGTMPVTVIWLQANFRSTPRILATANVTFESCMRRRVTELDYGVNDRLKNPYPGRPMGALSQLHLVEADSKTALASEAQVIIHRIQDLLTTPRDPADPESPCYRFRDMTILLSQASNSGPKLAAYLHDAGIPVFYDGKTNYYDLLQIRQTKALLQAIDNQWLDIPLLITLHMVPFSFNEAELVAIRLTDNRQEVTFSTVFHQVCEQDTELGRRCAAARETLRRWHMLQGIMALDEFMWLVLRESGYYACTGAMPGGDLHQANLRMLIARAADQEKRGRRSLREFLQTITDESKTGDATSAHTLSDNEDLVRIMTMHKSKGLQFPVVFLMRTGGELLRARRDTVLLHRELGISLPWVHRETGVRMTDTVLKRIFSGQMRMEERSERCRLLYVAMTRPQERLIVTAAWEKDKPVWQREEGDLRVQEADAMVDWLLQPVFDLDPSPITEEPSQRENWTVVRWPPQRVMQQMEAMESEELQEMVDVMTRQPGPDHFLWWDDPQEPQWAPAKLSASTLAHLQATPPEDRDQEETPDTKRIPADPEQGAPTPQLPPMPAFMQDSMPAAVQIGTAMHHALMLLPLEPLRAAPDNDMPRLVREALDRLAEEGILPPQEHRLLNPARLSAYLTSDLGRRMLSSPEVHREWPFDLLVADHGLTDANGIPLVGSVLLQGIIDCAFLQDDQWVLVDYKTDHFTDPAAFTAHHRPQLTRYAQALRTLTGRPVKEMWLFALSYGQAYRL